MMQFAIRRSPWLLAAGGLLFGIGTAADAATEDGAFAIRGFGSQTCAAIVAPLQEDPAAVSAATEWLLGYTTAFNRVQSQTFDVSPLPDGTDMLRMVVATCQHSPEARVEAVSYDVLSALATARLTASTPLVETRSDDAVVRVRRETLERLQAELIERGHLSGGADGSFGPETETALRSFQQEQGLPETGVADAATIVRLLVELPAQPD